MKTQCIAKTVIRGFLPVFYIIAFLVSFPSFLSAKATGPCVNCHTMHNSQNGTIMANYGTGAWKSVSSSGALTRGTCLGCHGMGTANKIYTMNGSDIPQVFHSDPSGDLAGGNFAYITGAKGSGASDRKGHNVIDLGHNDATLKTPPGILPATGHSMIISNTTLTCAGYIGCHGTRSGSYTGINSLKGSHHQNTADKCDVADNVYNSYRFLRGVKGLENNGQNNTATKWQNKDSLNHNEYFGDTTPMNVNCGNSCHSPGPGVQPPNHTISGFCATCHGLFHDAASIGTSSPFIRHPNDIVLPNSGEYAAYTAYSVEAPVARTTVASSISNTVAPGSDVVMCLSCHAAHGSNYPSMLRWDYNTMVAGGGGSGGCFTCHTNKK